MNKLLFSALLGATLLFTGCHKKMPIALPGGHSSMGGGNISGDVIPDNAVNAGSLDGNLNSKGGKDIFKKGAVSANGKYLGQDGLSKSGLKMLYFASDSYTLDDDQIKRFMSDLPKIKAITASSKILVEGNCDEFGTDEYNHALGLKRAKAVKSLLLNAGISADKIDTVSYGESNPTCTINAPACHAKNRRVEINKI